MDAGARAGREERGGERDRAAYLGVFAVGVGVGWCCACCSRGGGWGPPGGSLGPTSSLIVAGLRGRAGVLVPALVVVLSFEEGLHPHGLGVRVQAGGHGRLVRGLVRGEVRGPDRFRDLVPILLEEVRLRGSEVGHRDCADLVTHVAMVRGAVGAHEDAQRLHHHARRVLRGGGGRRRGAGRCG